MQLPVAAIEFQQAVAIAHVDNALTILGNRKVLRVDIEVGFEACQWWRALCPGVQRRAVHHRKHKH
jgi:hypothetical protein